MGRHCWASLAMTAILYAGSAHADAVGPPPEDCPSGSHGESCHGGEFCSPSTCAGDPDCDPGWTCAELDLCVARIDCASGWTPPGEHYWHDTVHGACPDGPGDCSTGTCRAVRVCMSDDGETLSGRHGCGCRTAATSRPGRAAALAFLAMATLVLIRRRHFPGESPRRS